MFVSDLRKSLLSVKKLTEKGLKVIFEDITCNIVYEGQSVAVGDIYENLYKLKNNNKVLSIAQVHDKNGQHQWH